MGRLVRGRANWEQKKLDEEVKEIAQEAEWQKCWERKERKEKLEKEAKKFKRLNAIDAMRVAQGKAKLYAKTLPSTTSLPNKKRQADEDLDATNSKKLKVYNDVESHKTAAKKATQSAVKPAKKLAPKPITAASTVKTKVRPVQLPPSLVDENGVYKGTAGLPSPVKPAAIKKRKASETESQEGGKRVKVDNTVQVKGSKGRLQAAKVATSRHEKVVKTPKAMDHGKDSKDDKVAPTTNTAAVRKAAVDAPLPAALKNFKCACFANSVVHMLLAVTELVDALPKNEDNLLDLLKVTQKDLDVLGTTRAGKKVRESLEKSARALQAEGKL